MKRKNLILLSLGFLFHIQATGICWSQTTERVSLGPLSLEGNNASNDPSISADGRHVTFVSNATNLVAADTNNKVDVFVRDLQTEITTRISVTSVGVEGDDVSSDPSISGDGRYVAFTSDATNLLGAGNDNNGWSDIFVRDRDVDADGIYDEVGAVSTLRVSVYSDETESIDPSNNPSISGDGRHVAFGSGGELDLTATEILLLFDVFVHDRDTDRDGIYDETGAVSTVRVSEDSDRNEANGVSSDPSISGDGRYVAFTSDATNLLGAGNDNNGWSDIFVRDRDVDADGIYDEVGAVSTLRVSIDSGGGEGDGDSYSPSISADGRYVAFQSQADNLVANDTNVSTDIFVHDRDADGDGIYDDEDGTYDPGEVSTIRVSVHSDGTEGNLDSTLPSISADGRYVTFTSDASNLVDDDTNGSTDIFVHDLQTGATTRVSVDSSGIQGNGNSSAPAISTDGTYVAFESDASNLVVGDGNGFFDIFVYEEDPLPPNNTQPEGNNSGGSGWCFIATAASDWADF